MQIDRKTCLKLLEENSLVPNKDKGQNYLVNPTVAQRIVKALEFDDTDKILEIGSGIGSITHFLNEKTSNLSVIDIDEKSCCILKQLYPNLTVINGDALKHNLSSYDKLISNVPYSITSNLLEYVLLNGSNLNQCIFMVQEDAYKRIVSLKGKDYGPLSVLMHLKADITPLFKVGHNNFYPHPHCTSIVFELKFSNKYNVTPMEYHAVKTLFTNRRKTLLNNLTLLTSKERATTILNKMNLSLNTRPEEISPETYMKLVSLYLNMGR